MLFLTVKSKITDEWLYFNEPVTNVNVSEHCIDCKTLTGKWEIFYSSNYSVMITNREIRDVKK